MTTLLRYSAFGGWFGMVHDPDAGTLTDLRHDYVYRDGRFLEPPVVGETATFIHGTGSSVTFGPLATIGPVEDDEP